MPDTLETTFIVDADVHIHEDPGQMAEYASDPWDVALREIAKIPERYLDLPGMSPRAEFRTPFPGGSNRPQLVTSAADMRVELNELHVDLACCFPTTSCCLRWCATLASPPNSRAATTHGTTTDDSPKNPP